MVHTYRMKLIKSICINCATFSYWSVPTKVWKTWHNLHSSLWKNKMSIERFSFYPLSAVFWWERISCAITKEASRQGNERERQQLEWETNGKKRRRELLEGGIFSEAIMQANYYMLEETESRELEKCRHTNSIWTNISVLAVYICSTGKESLPFSSETWVNVWNKSRYGNGIFFSLSFPLLPGITACNVAFHVWCNSVLKLCLAFEGKKCRDENGLVVVMLLSLFPFLLKAVQLGTILWHINQNKGQSFTLTWPR